LRVAAGLTQSDLAGDRFSKEYVSQIERGKTRPTTETIGWLAGKLGVDAAFLERGVSADERSRVEAMLARAEALTNAHHYDVALFSESLKLAEASQLPCDLLRSEVLGWRSRCYRRQRDLEAAREDVERALELAQSLDDHRTMANVYFQASMVAERMGHWVLAR